MLTLSSMGLVGMEMKGSERVSSNIWIVLDGGNGTPDGAQAHRDYAWRVDGMLPICDLYEFEVVNQNSTGFHSWTSNDLLVMWWKPSYVGTTQQIKASCICEDYYGNVWFETTTRNITIHN
ncbi:hypothetical protein AAOE16_05685 [Ekhidna sp. MALMAid0563]|uniref:hypothetical protein n=1 Tax=Ekhidna sp. MALMAid0563 TaxID=3143937 RepID=UPI0032DFD7B7